MSYIDQTEVKKQIDELLNAGRIRPSMSPFGASVLLRDKKDKSGRIVIDYRALNRITIKDKYPLSRIDEMLERLSKARFF